MKKILLVEDNRAIRKVVHRHLKQMGFDVTEAVDGLEAIQNALLQHFDLLLSDVRLPGIDGIELAALLRDDNPVLPVILMTAYIERDLSDALALGVMDILPKPVYRCELASAVGQVLSPA